MAVCSHSSFASFFVSVLLLPLLFASGVFAITCPPGWYGYDMICDIPICSANCQQYQCYSPYTCIAGMCDIGYVGATGSTCVEACYGVAAPGGCANGGTCIGPNRCQCVNGWSGESCSYFSCPSGFCQNGGTCAGPNQCSCINGYTGTNCAYPPLCGILPSWEYPIGIIVPLYISPATTAGVTAWNELLSAVSSYPVKIIAVVNPQSGPSANPDPAYAAYMNQFYNAGITMVGYVDTACTTTGCRTLAAIEADIQTYSDTTKYPYLNGIFFDDTMPNDNGLIQSLFSPLYSYITLSMGWANVILNPGQTYGLDSNYLTVSTNIVILEDSYARFSLHDLSATWLHCALDGPSKSTYQYKFSGIVYSVPNAGDMDSLISSMHNGGIGYVYVTDTASYQYSLASFFLYMAQQIATENL